VAEISFTLISGWICTRGKSAAEACRGPWSDSIKHLCKLVLPASENRADRLEMSVFWELYSPTFEVCVAAPFPLTVMTLINSAHLFIAMQLNLCNWFETKWQNKNETNCVHRSFVVPNAMTHWNLLELEFLKGCQSNRHH
jgi:hypothetical protein